jgi:simple sugar transport system permease protein
VESLGLETRQDLFGFVIVAILVGVLFYLIVWRTRFGYDLRASGTNPDAARVSGVDPNAMVIRTMLLSGAIAGLVGMSDLLGFFHQYTLDFPVGLGFTGIAVALVGRNHPVGIALAALLFGFIERSAQILDLEEIPKEIITIMQGVIILSVVIAYEVVRRLIQAQEVRAAAEKAMRITAEREEARA